MISDLLLFTADLAQPYRAGATVTANATLGAYVLWWVRKHTKIHTHLKVGTHILASRDCAGANTLIEDT